jgi:DNA-binding CsgD family transcriptional regulator
VQRLRNFSTQSGVSVVIGQNLNTHGKLYSRQGLRYRDNEIHVRKVRDKFRLEVVPPSTYVQTMSWELAYDEGRKLFRATIKAKRKEARQMGKLALTGNDKRIIEAMQGKGVMSPGQIIRVTGLSRSTVYQRLEREDKGCRVIGLEAPEGGRVYLADPRQPPDWRE